MRRRVHSLKTSAIGSYGQRTLRLLEAAELLNGESQRVQAITFVTDHPFVIFGAETGDHLRIDVTGRAHPEATDFWDGNWLNTPISVHAGAFRGRIVARLRTTDLADFRRRLELVNEALVGEAVLKTIEGWIELRVIGDGRGHMDTRAKLTDEPGLRNELHFAIDGLDQTHVVEVLKQLWSIEARYPTVGTLRAR